MANILIVDDDPDERALISFALRFAGNKIQSVDDLPDLSSYTKSFKPDLILMDANLEKINPNDERQSLQLDKEFGDISIIYIVDNEMETTKQSGPETLKDYILRPISPDELTRKVNSLLRG